MHQLEMQGKSHCQVAENLYVCPSTVSRTVALFKSVDKRKHSPSSGSVVITEIDKLTPYKQS